MIKWSLYNHLYLSLSTITMCILKRKKKSSSLHALKKFIIGWMNFFSIQKPRLGSHPYTGGNTRCFYEKSYVFKIGRKPIDLKTKLKHLTKAWQRGNDKSYILGKGLHEESQRLLLQEYDRRQHERWIQHTTSWIIDLPFF